MKLLGPYRNSLQAFHYEELLQLYKQAIAAGDFAANKTFDENAINVLVKQSQDFATLPLASAGQRMTDESLNTPIDLLTARFNAIVSEASDFDSKAANLISVTKKDTILLDELLAGAILNKQISFLPKLNPSTKFAWDYGVGTGPSSTEISNEDPNTHAIFNDSCITGTFTDWRTGNSFSGLVAPKTSTAIPIKSMNWTWEKMTPGEQSEDLYGDAWAELNLLEDHPIINFLPNPEIQVLLPLGGKVTGVFNVTGSVGGSLPIYVRTLFIPRRNQVVLSPQNAISNGTFESSLTDWVVGNGWTQVTDSGAHMGSKYMSKASLPAWNSGTTYSIGNAVHYLGTEYKSLTNGNINNLPNAIGSTSWTLGGILISESFPLNPLSDIYVESWVKNLSSNGILNIALSCRDENDVEVGPQVSTPGVDQADSYVMVSNILTSIDNPSITSGRLVFYVTNQTTGTWSVDDIRVHVPQNLSSYTVNPDDVSVYIPKENSDQPKTVYFQNEQFVADNTSNITFMGLNDGTPYTVRFTENYPAYQCSVNEEAWSPIVMLDPDRPYPDSETKFDVVKIEVNNSGDRVLFPITDETGVPTGLTLQMLGRPSLEYYIEVTTPATQRYGATATLEIEFTNPSYINSISLSPFSSYPLKLTDIQTESIAGGTRAPLLRGIGFVTTPEISSPLIDKPMTITFAPPVLNNVPIPIRKMYLTFQQENYNLTEHVVQAADSLRRDTLFALQSFLPFGVRRISRAVPTYYRGAQYTFGIEDIEAKFQVHGIGTFIAGPHRFDGCPDLVNLYVDSRNNNLPDYYEPLSDVGITGNGLGIYMCWKAYNSSGQVINSELVGLSIGDQSISTPFPFPSASLLDRSTVDHVDIFLKFVLSTQWTGIPRYLLQVSNV